MTDITETLAAKSDQLNAVDIMGAELVITIRKVDVKQGDQPVSIYFDGDNNRPWKPSKGMRRVLAAAWSTDSKVWIGRKAKIAFEPSVTFGGVAVGGIRVIALSDIPAQGINCALTISRTKRIPYPVALLVIEEKAYPDATFDKAFATMVKKMQSGEATLQQIKAQCQKTGTLSASQLERLEKAAPIEVSEADESDDEIM